MPAPSSPKPAPAGLILAIGLMSGTSLDGVDVALIETDGEIVAQFGPTAYRAYTQEERAALHAAIAASAAQTKRNERIGVVAEAETVVNTAHGEVVERFLADNRLKASDIAVVGFHGQTVLHRPERHITIQIGDGCTLAKRLGIAVIYDFRAADVAAGGQGAPLAPLFHRALVRRSGREAPEAVLNIGGVANVTFVDGDDVIACDTGPGNALIDDFVHAHTGESMDADGRLAAAGRVDEEVVARFLAHPFFALPPPKSLDRNDFRELFAKTLDAVSLADGAATLTALTAAAAARIVPRLPRPPRRWIISGGGARNPTLMRMLADRLAPARVETADQAGWSTDAIEAQAFAYLAVRSRRGLPISLPSTTGVPHPLTGGVLASA
jgi:anhydro-N-acetylmuramic acid kinase